MTSYCTIVTSAKHFYQTIGQFDKTIVFPRKLATGSIHDYLFCCCPWWVFYLRYWELSVGKGHVVFTYVNIHWYFELFSCARGDGCFTDQWLSFPMCCHTSMPLVWAGDPSVVDMTYCMYQIHAWCGSSVPPATTGQPVKVDCLACAVCFTEFYTSILICYSRYPGATKSMIFVSCVWNKK